MVKEWGHVCQKMRKAAFGPSSISLLPQTQFSGSLLAPHQIISCSFPTLSMPPMDPSDHRPIVFHPISPLYPRPIWETSPALNTGHTFQKSRYVVHSLFLQDYHGHFKLCSRSPAAPSKPTHTSLPSVDSTDHCPRPSSLTCHCVLAPSLSEHHRINLKKIR